MTKKDYIAIANIIKSASEQVKEQNQKEGYISITGDLALHYIIREYANYAQADNPRFSKDAFIFACGFNPENYRN